MFLHKPLESMPAVVRAVIKAKGGQDEYQNTFILYITICNQTNNSITGVLSSS